MEDRDLACVRGSLYSETAAQPLDERAQVEDDLAFLGGLNGPRVLALEDLNEARVRATIRFLPQGLSLWCLEYSVGGLHRDVLQRAA